MSARGPWLQTRSGKAFHILDPQPEEICIEDIAHALSNLCRFGGHPSEHYSVAEHSVRVSRIVSPALALHALLHDAAEAYLGDVSSPVKGFLPEFKRLEAIALEAIMSRFGLVYYESPEIKRADLILRYTEARDLMGPPPEPWEQKYDPLPEKIVPLSSHEARLQFLERFSDLTGKRAQLPKHFYRIGEVSKMLAVKPHVLRYWETEFREAKPERSKKGQRVYSRDQVQRFTEIQRLLHVEGYTIAGARRRMAL